MGEDTIPELNRRLGEMKEEFQETAAVFVERVKVTTQRFTPEDRVEFDGVLREIREYAHNRITQFMNQKITSKTNSFISHFDTFKTEAADLCTQGSLFRSNLQEMSKRAKEEGDERQRAMERIIDKYAVSEQYRKVMRAFQSNVEHRRKRASLQSKAEEMYREKTLQKCFFPWRALTYKDGHQNQVKKHTQIHLRKVHSEFGNIVEVLKEKILQTEEMIRVKKAAKSQFAYALSKNLLKTISNLSLQVMSLNQIASKDKQTEDQTTQFISQVNELISTKLESVMFCKEAMFTASTNIYQEEREVPRQPPVPKTSTQPIPNRKKISFA